MKNGVSKLLAFVCACFLSFAGHAQQFKWAKGGGTIATIGTSSSDWEQVKFMCADPNGNVYVVSPVGNDPVVADTFSEISVGVNNNVLLTSYNCNGQMRWAKLLQNTGYGVTPFGIQADRLGNIYVAGAYGAGGTTMYIGNDTTIGPPVSNFLSTGLIQFDSSGHFKWIRYVGPNTFAGETSVYGGPIAIDGANNTHYFCYVTTGTTLMTGVTSVYGVYDMTYNTLGTLLSAVRLEMDSAWFLHGAVFDSATNKLYTYGEINQNIYGGGAVDTFFAAAFDASRNRLWQYFTGNDVHASAISGIAMDKNKLLYFPGVAATYSLSIPSTFVFNGDSVLNTHYGNYAMSVVLSTDTNGHPLWIKQFDGSLSINRLSAVTCLPNNKIAAIGTFAGEVIDNNGVNIVTSSGEGQNPLLVVVDSSGDLQTIQQIHGDGFYDGGNAITSDKVGNIYVAGYVEDSIWAGTPAVPPYHSTGGNTDFYVMKYGVDCSCTSMPVAAYTDTGTHTFGFTYTGTTTGIDSVVWNYGDGTSGAGASASHTYTAIGTYNACVTVYTDCGRDSVCHTITVSTTGVPVLSVSSIRVYPNPVSEELHIIGVPQHISYRMLSVTGPCMGRGELDAGNSTLSLKGYAAGFYILELTDGFGLREMVRVVRE